MQLRQPKDVIEVPQVFLQWRFISTYSNKVHRSAVVYAKLGSGINSSLLVILQRSCHFLWKSELRPMKLLLVFHIDISRFQFKSTITHKSLHLTLKPMKCISFVFDEKKTNLPTSKWEQVKDCQTWHLPEMNPIHLLPIAFYLLTCLQTDLSCFTNFTEYRTRSILRPLRL